MHTGQFYKRTKKTLPPNRIIVPSEESDDDMVDWPKRVQPTRGWTVAVQSSTNCTHSSCPSQWGPVSTV